jgi:hypothetical protein
MMPQIVTSINDNASSRNRQPLLAVAKAPVPPVFCTIKTGKGMRKAGYTAGLASDRRSVMDLLSLLN